MQVGGNGVAAQIWLARYHATGSEPEYENELRDFIRQKYVERKWIDEVALREQFSKIASIAKVEVGGFFFNWVGWDSRIDIIKREWHPL